MKFKTGIVGCGRIAGINDQPRDTGFVGTHAQAYHQHPLFEIKAVTCPDRYKFFQKAWNIPNAYKNLDEMLKNEKLDVISICSPNEYHYPQIKKILNSNSCPKVIFAEKPICLKQSELEELKKMAIAANCEIIVNHSRRYDPGHIKVKQLINSQELGKLLSARCDYYGGWLHNGCHLIDTLRMLFDEEPIVESLNLGPPGRTDDPCLNVKLRIKDAPVDVTGFDKKYYNIYDSEFKFEKGRISLQDFGRKIIVEKVETNKNNEKTLIPFSDSPWKGLDSPMYHAIDLIAKHLKDKEPLSGHGVTLEEVTGTMNILLQTKDNYDKRIINKLQGKQRRKYKLLKIHCWKK